MLQAELGGSKSRPVLRNRSADEDRFSALISKSSGGMKCMMVDAGKPGPQAGLSIVAGGIVAHPRSCAGIFRNVPIPQER